MRHFLPKRTISSAACSRPKPAPNQQPAQPMPATPEPRPDKDRQDGGRSCSARRYPFPKRLAQDRLGSGASEVLLISQTERGGAESCYRRATPQAVSNVPPVSPLSAGCRGKCVINSPRAHFSARASKRCDSGQNKTYTFSKREQISSSA